VLLAVASLAIAVTSASAGSLAAPDAVVKAKGSNQNLHWKVADGTLPTDGTLKVVNKTHQDHTFSLVEQSALPDTNSEFRHCFDVPAGHHICRWVFKAHKQAGFASIVDTNNDGFNDLFDIAPNKQQGDSLFLQKKSRRLTVSATPNTTLHFMCIIHPWMQGSIQTAP
jgi:hypothetical protein